MAGIPDDDTDPAIDLIRLPAQGTSFRDIDPEGLQPPFTLDDPSIMQAAAPILSSPPQPDSGDELVLEQQEQQQQEPLSTAPLRSRMVDRNWARVREKVVGIDVSTPQDNNSSGSVQRENNQSIPQSLSGGQAVQPATLATGSGGAVGRGVGQGSTHPPAEMKAATGNSRFPASNPITEHPRTFPTMEGLGTVSTGLRGVLGFRTAVVQRTQLRKMEKEIEKALARHASDQSQPRSRTVARIGTGTRGMIPGASYNLMAFDTGTIDRSLVEELSDILTRWKALIVEVPCKNEIFRALSKMLLASRTEPLSRADATAVLNLVDQMRQMFPLQSDPEDLQDVLWCLSLLSPKYACHKDRIVTLINQMLAPGVITATVPLLPRNIHAILASLVTLLSEQAALPKEAQDRRIRDLSAVLMDRIRFGDLGVKSDPTADRAQLEHNAEIAFLRGLIECIRLRDQTTVHYLLHELLPVYWVEPDSRYPLALDGPVRIFGQAASEFVLNAPVAYADGSELTKSLILDMTIFLQEFLPPAGLRGSVSNEAVTSVVRFILMVFSIEYLEVQSQEPSTSFDIPRPSRDDMEPTPRASISTESEREAIPRTPPRSPLSPNVSGENFQARILPPQDQGLPDEKANPVVQQARNYFDAIWDQGYQGTIVDQMKIESENIVFRRLINLYHRVILGSSTARSSLILNATLSTFFNKLVVHQPEPNERLSGLLLQLSVVHRASFFKPMIACVASDSTQFVADYLCILSCLETHMGLVDLYMRDADMICVIAMTDVGHERPRRDSQAQAQGLKWGSCTVGQCIIVLEFIYAIKRLASSGDNYEIEVGKMFLIDLERKLGMYLITKEKKILVPRPIRVMLCMIFYEIRMLCKTIHRPGWLPRILDWALNQQATAEGGSAQGGPHGISETMRLRIKHIYSNVDGLVGERKDRYTLKIDNRSASTLKPSRTESSVGARRASTNESNRASNQYMKANATLQPKRIVRMPDIRLDETVAVLTLLITVHSAIHVSEYLQLIDPLWNIYCLESGPKVASSAAFLFVKCADVAPKAIHNIISRDLNSDNPFKRLSAIERLNTLFDHRNELLIQPYVIDPSSRGPFRTTVIQVPFVTTEVGSNRYTMDEPRWLTELKSVGNFPIDIRNRFQELGWGQKDQQETELTRRAQTPLMLSWTGYLDGDYESKANFGRTYTMLPKDRHATVLIPVLNSLNLGTIDLMDDKAIGVRSAAINFLSDYIRNEPVLFVRSFFAEVVHARPDRQRSLISRLHLLLSGNSKLPPAFAFSLFNHLLGLLKWFQRNSKPLGLDMLATVLPLLADVVISTNDIVFKDFKRNKVDIFFAGLGRFWFKSAILPESMFPAQLTNPGDILPRLGIPHQLFQMAMVNISQIQFMTSFLVRFPLEATDVKASVGRFNRMPKLNSLEALQSSKLEDNQYLPDVSKCQTRFLTATSYRDRNARSLSSLRARAWLSFVLNLIQRMDKQSTDRLELMNILNGVNVILLEQGDDLGIVGQALEVYITAATRLRRLFASQNGYALFFPALFKIYCDSASSRIVQDTIDATFYRFYLIHQEAFILQSLGAIVPLMLRNMSKEQSTIMGRRLFAFMEALDQPTTTYHSKALGVPSLSVPYHDSKPYGGPQLEIPHWISSFIPRNSKIFHNSGRTNILHKAEFTIADSIKLFLAVIAYDPGSVRSEQFVRVLKMVLPFFLDREAHLMTSGLDSLIDVFAKFGRSSKPLVPTSFVPPPVLPRATQSNDDTQCDISRFALVSSRVAKTQAVKGITWAQNDRVAIKHEFVCLIQHFCDRGGQLADDQHQMMAAFIKSILKDYISLKIPCTTDWLHDYLKHAILPVRSVQQGSNAVLYLIVHVSGYLRTYYKMIDFSGFFDGLQLVAKDERHFLRNSLTLSNVFQEKVLSPALTIGVKDDWSSGSIYVPQAKFCDSLVDLMLAMINNADTDTISELEQAVPTPRLMAYIVVPLCLRFKTRYHSNCLDILEMQFWLRMLGLTVKAAEYDPTSRRTSITSGLFAPVINAARANRRRQSVELLAPMSPQQPMTPHPFVMPMPATPQTPGHRRRSSFLHRDDHDDEDHNQQQQQQQQASENTMNATPGLFIDFIALRIIMVRGERYLTYHPGCWLDIFNIIKKYFSAHTFSASSFSGPIAIGNIIGRHNSTSSSGPPSPNVNPSYPATPRVEVPPTPLWRDGAAGLAGMSGGLSPYPGSTYTQENTRMTAMGYILWSFAETILFNRLPLMIMMRPFLSDQLRQIDSYPAPTSHRLSRSASSTGPNSPAFYWPSPSMLPASSPGPGAGYSPGMSPLHLRSDSVGRKSDAREDPATVKLQQRAERRKQWKSWAKPTQTMNALTVIQEPLFDSHEPMSPNLHAARSPLQRSFVSTSEQVGGDSAGEPRTPNPLQQQQPQLQHHLHHHRRHRKHHRSDLESKSETVLPYALVERAIHSMQHVRSMMLTKPEGATAFSEFGVPMYPEKRSPSTGLSPSMALQTGDKRDSSQFFPAEGSQSADHHFLAPGRYERQPSSPGFGSMFLAREAAIRGPIGSSSQEPATPAQEGLSPSRPISLTVPRSLSADIGRDFLRVGAKEAPNVGNTSDSGSDGSPFVIGSPQLHLSSGGETLSPGTLSLPGEASPGGASPAPKKSRSILKPTIITTSPPVSDQNPQLQSAVDLPQTPGQQLPSDLFTPSGMRPIRRLDSNTSDDCSSMSGGPSINRRPSLTSDDQMDYRMACLQARTKTFIQNIEEETRLVLACFPSVFSIKSAPLPSATSSATAAAAGVTPAPIATVTVEPPAPDPVAPLATQPGSTSEAGTGVTRSIQQNEQARVSTSSLTVPSRKTPSITIQDQSSFLAPSPINPLPVPVEGGEHLFFSRQNRPASDTLAPSSPPPAPLVGFTIGSPPPAAAKERRSKSVIFQQQLSLGPSGSGFSLPTSGPGSLAASPGQPLSNMATPPTLSVTVSTPLIPQSNTPPPLTLSLPSTGLNRSDVALEPLLPTININSTTPGPDSNSSATLPTFQLHGSPPPPTYRDTFSVANRSSLPTLGSDRPQSTSSSSGLLVSGLSLAPPSSSGPSTLSVPSASSTGTGVGAGAGAIEPSWATSPSLLLPVPEHETRDEPVNPLDDTPYTVVGLGLNVPDSSILASPPPK
ncbi:hypothetical protein K457DRAFT_32202 [Linnemannia elongata AG-77]|uniref:Uncharacterized protein n=1 Tax=Linnemannia elongata AG-77 TaxID=1314771 RepID=A0A197JWG9_9FUNG|nr:hypothetical protein K457DRAFT_32202 [Linnemannia elongata AG-77]